MLSSSGRLRRGVTLLEVLVAMGVTSVGLLGVAALIPLGRMELAAANKLDDASTIGRWAFRDLMVHGYIQPEMWIDPVTGYQAINSSGGPSRFVSIKDATVPPWAPIVIDPLMIAPRHFGTPTGSVDRSSTDGTHREKCRLFPYSLNLPGASEGMPEYDLGNRPDGLPRIARVSLRTCYPDVFLPQRAQFEFLMRNDLASRFFKSNDDLIVKVPKNRSRRPVQIFTETTPGGFGVNTVNNDGRESLANSDDVKFSNVAFRKFRGDMSWFIVAEPSLAESYNSAENAPAAAGASGSIATTKHYRVWTVVCHQRDLRDVSGQTLSDPKGIGERMVYVDFIDRNTARLRCGGLSNEGAASNALEVKASQWFAVVGRYAETALGGQKRAVMEWYRITGVADRPTSLGNNNWYREVTLVGRQFSGNGFDFIDESPEFKYPDLDMQPQTGLGILVSGACGVYEKSVYLDRPSQWSIRYN